MLLILYQGIIRQPEGLTFAVEMSKVNMLSDPSRNARYRRAGCIYDTNPGQMMEERYIQCKNVHYLVSLIVQTNKQTNKLQITSLISLNNMIYIQTGALASNVLIMH